MEYSSEDTFRAAELIPGLHGCYTTIQNPQGGAAYVPCAHHGMVWLLQVVTQ